MTKSKTTEALKQWLGHFLALGILGGLLFGPFNIGLLLVRAFSGWKWVPWPYKGQRPPGDPMNVDWDEKRSGRRESVYLPSSRVEDLHTDLIFQFAGHAVGQAIREGLLPWQGL